METELLRLADAFLRAPGDESARALGMCFSRCGTSESWKELRAQGIWMWMVDPKWYGDKGVLWSTGKLASYLVTFPGLEWRHAPPPDVPLVCGKCKHGTVAPGPCKACGADRLPESEDAYLWV